MLLSSWCNSCGPLTVQCWVIQTDAYHCSIPRGEIWTAISIQEWPCFLHPPSSPASHKHIAAGTHTWPVSLNTSSTCIRSGLNQYFCGIQRGICNVKSLMLRKFWCELCKFVLHLNFSSYLTKYCEQNRPKICHQLLASLRDNTFVIRHQKCDQKHRNGRNVWNIRECLWDQNYWIYAAITSLSFSTLFIMWCKLCCLAVNTLLPKALGLHRSRLLFLKFTGNLNTGWLRILHIISTYYISDVNLRG